MSRRNGFTLIELLIVVCVLSVLLTASLPTFSRIIEDVRLRSAMNDCVRSLQFARAEATLRKCHVSVMSNNGSWQAGWTVFVDSNATGFWETGEQRLYQQTRLPSTIRVTPTTTARHHITYAPDGQSQQVNGSFQADSLYFCPTNKSLQGFRIVINRVGRIRVEQIPMSSEKCAV